MSLNPAEWVAEFRTRHPDCNVDDGTLVFWFTKAMDAVHRHYDVSDAVIAVGDAVVTLDTAGKIIDLMEHLKRALATPRA